MVMTSMSKVFLLRPVISSTLILLAASSFGCSGTTATLPQPTELLQGKHQFEHASGRWEGITDVWYYRPEQSNERMKVVMVIHGAGRNAEDYLDAWIPFAEEDNLLVVAPEFGEEHSIRVDGDWEWRFQTGNLVGWFSKDVDEAAWYFTSVERLFTTVRDAVLDVEEHYVLFGHSAGGQFVHRMVLFQPDAQFDLAIAANSGWYTYPSEEDAYPYGLAGAPYSKERIQAAFARPLVVFLGTDDTPDQGSFRTRASAMEQGSDRVLRGEGFFEFAQKKAAELGFNFQWRLEYAQGIGHDYRGMAGAAVRLMRDWE